MQLHDALDPEEPTAPGSEWIVGFVDAIDLAGQEPTSSQLLTLAVELQREGFVEEAEAIIEYLAYYVPDDQLKMHIEVCEDHVRESRELGDHVAVDTIGRALQRWSSRVTAEM